MVAMKAQCSAVVLEHARKQNPIFALIISNNCTEETQETVSRKWAKNITGNIPARWLIHIFEKKTKRK